MLVLRRRQEVVLGGAAARPLAYPVQEGVLLQVLASVKGHLHSDLEQAALRLRRDTALLGRPRDEEWSLHNHFTALYLAVQDDFAELTLH